VSLSPARTGEALLVTAGELLRIWRSARAQVRPDIFPGLADAAVGAFLERAARALGAGGADPAAIYAGLVAPIHVDPRDPHRSAREIETEWRLLGEVLRATCEALGADEDSRAALARAIQVARERTEDLVAGRGPRGMVRVARLAGFVPPRRRRNDVAAGQ
jgi:hypothetical protein